MCTHVSNEDRQALMQLRTKYCGVAQFTLQVIGSEILLQQHNYLMAADIEYRDHINYFTTSASVLQSLPTNTINSQLNVLNQSKQSQSFEPSGTRQGKSHKSIPIQSQQARCRHLTSCTMSGQQCMQPLFESKRSRHELTWNRGHEHVRCDPMVCPVFALLSDSGVLLFMVRICQAVQHAIMQTSDQSNPSDCIDYTNRVDAIDYVKSVAFTVTNYIQQQANLIQHRTDQVKLTNIVIRQLGLQELSVTDKEMVYYAVRTLNYWAKGCEAGVTRRNQSVKPPLGNNQSTVYDKTTSVLSCQSKQQTNTVSDALSFRSDLMSPVSSTLSTISACSDIANHMNCIDLSQDTISSNNEIVQEQQSNIANDCTSVTSVDQSDNESNGQQVSIATKSSKQTTIITYMTRSSSQIPSNSNKLFTMYCRKDVTNGLHYLNKFTLLYKQTFTSHILKCKNSNTYNWMDNWKLVFKRNIGNLTMESLNKLFEQLSVFVISQYAQTNIYKKAKEHRQQSPQAMFVFSDILRTAILQTPVLQEVVTKQLLQMLIEFNDGERRLSDYDTYVSNTTNNSSKYSDLLRYAEWLWLAEDLLNNVKVRQCIEKYNQQAGPSVKTPYQQAYADCIVNHDDNIEKLRKAFNVRMHVTQSSPMRCKVLPAVSINDLPRTNNNSIDIKAITHDIVYAGVLQRFNANQFKDTQVTVFDMLKYCTTLYNSSNWTTEFTLHNQMQQAETQAYLVTHVEFAVQHWGIELDTDYKFAVERKFISDNMYYFMSHQHYEIVGEFIIALQRMKPTASERTILTGAKSYLALQIQNDLTVDNLQREMRYRPINPKSTLSNFKGHTVYCMARALLPV